MTMNPGPAISLVIILTGNFSLSLGMVLQKYAVTGLTMPRSGDRNRRRLKAVWVAGLLFINIVPVFQYFAVGGLGAQRTGAAMGICVVYMLLLSAVILKERVKPLSMVWALVMVISIAAVNLLPEPERTGLSLPYVYAALFTPVLFLIPIAFTVKRPGSTLKAALFGIASGAWGGFSIIAMRFVNNRLTGSNEFGLQGIPASWIFWVLLYFLSASAAFLLMQLAYADGPMQASAPYFYGLSVIWPVLWSYPIFGISVTPVPILLFTLTAFSAGMIQRSSAVPPSGPPRHAEASHG